MTTLQKQPWFHPAMLTPPDPDVKESAWSGHLPFAAWIVAVARPRTVVELGSHWGTSYFGFCRAAVEHGLETRLSAIDTWQGDKHAGAYSEDVLSFVSAFNARFADRSTLLRMLFDDARERFAEGSIDLLHIDGLHTYEAVKHDFETWLPKMSSRGIVLFHDTIERGVDFGVWRYWAELQSRYRTFEFAHSHGLGVLFLGAALPPEIEAMLASPDAVRTAFRKQAEAAGYIRPTGARATLAKATQVLREEGWHGIKRRLAARIG